MMSPEAIMPKRFIIVTTPVPRTGPVIALPPTTTSAISPPVSMNGPGFTGSFGGMPPSYTAVFPFTSMSTQMMTVVVISAPHIDTSVALTGLPAATASVPLTATCIAATNPAAISSIMKSMIFLRLSPGALFPLLPFSADMRTIPAVSITAPAALMRVISV